MDLSGIHITADVGTIALALATAVVGASALVQYIKAERWKRMELIRECYCHRVLPWVLQADRTGVGIQYRDGVYPEGNSPSTENMDDRRRR